MNAYADDLGMVMYQVFVELPRALHPFGRWAAASGLLLNAAKCIIIPLWSAKIDAIREWLQRVVPSFATCRISFYGRYLGVVLGPHSASHAWDGLATKLLARASDIRASDGGFAMKLKAFGVYCTSLLQFRLQFSPPTPTLRRFIAMLHSGLRPHHGTQFHMLLSLPSWR